MEKQIQITAIVCTHNPRPEHLGPTLDALRAQDLPRDRWEFLLIDNASDEPLDGRVDVSWHPNGRVIQEDRVGLTRARLRSAEEARAELLVYIDDDNILDASYLSAAIVRMEQDEHLGACGGRSHPVFEVEPPDWFDGLGINLACRDLGDEVIEACWEGVPVPDRRYPVCSPVGAGMVIRKQAFAAYRDAAADDPVRRALDRTGNSLASGGDNDIVMSVLNAGWSIAYVPELSLQHLIPAKRLTPEYLAKMAYASSQTWVLALDVHGIRPWPRVPAWTVPFRKVRAYLKSRAWAGDPNWIRWRGACGQFDGRALINTTA